jgi:WD repeat-containing protein 61
MRKINIAKVAHFSGHKGSIFSLCKGLHPDTFYSGADDGYVVEWNYKTKGDGKLLVQVNRPVYSMHLNTGQQQLYCGTAAGNLHVIDLDTRNEVRNIEAHTLGLFDIKESPQYLITSGGDGRICIWNKQLELVKKIDASDKSARVITISEQRNEFAVGFSDHHIRIYSLETLELLHEYKGHDNSVFALTYSPDNQHLYSGGRDVMLRNWEVKSNYTRQLDIAAHTLHINAIAFSPDGNVYATVSMDKTLKIWDAQTNELLKVADKQRHQGHTTSVNKLLWLSNDTLLTCSDDRAVMMWEIDVLSGEDETLTQDLVN